MGTTPRSKYDVVKVKALLPVRYRAGLSKHAQDTCSSTGRSARPTRKLNGIAPSPDISSICRPELVNAYGAGTLVAFLRTVDD